MEFGDKSQGIISAYWGMKKAIRSSKEKKTYKGD